MVSKRSLSCPSGDTVIKNLNQKLLKATYNISNHYKHALRTKFCHFRHFSLEILFCCRLILIGTWCNFVYITNTTNNYIHDCHCHSWFIWLDLFSGLCGRVQTGFDWQLAGVEQFTPLSLIVTRSLVTYIIPGTAAPTFSQSRGLISHNWKHPRAFQINCSTESNSSAVWPTSQCEAATSSPACGNNPEQIYSTHYGRAGNPSVLIWPQLKMWP